MKSTCDYLVKIISWYILSYPESLGLWARMWLRRWGIAILVMLSASTLTLRIRIPSQFTTELLETRTRPSSTSPAYTPLCCVKRWYSASQSFCSVGNVDLYSRCAPPSKHHLNSHYTQGREYAHFPPKLSEGFLKFFVPVYARYTPFFPIPL